MPFVKSDPLYEPFIREWENANKMRQWFHQQKNRISDPDEDARLKKIDDLKTNIIDKAKFLVKLEIPSFFQTMDPSQDVMSSLTTLNQPQQSLEHASSTQVAELNKSQDSVAREWKNKLKSEGTIQSDQDKRAEIRKCGTSAVLVCL